MQQIFPKMTVLIIHDALVLYKRHFYDACDHFGNISESIGSTQAGSMAKETGSSVGLDEDG